MPSGGHAGGGPFYQLSYLNGGGGENGDGELLCLTLEDDERLVDRTQDIIVNEYEDDMLAIGFRRPFEI